MGSSSPQEGGTTDEDYYGQPHQMFNRVMKPTAPKEKKSFSPILQKQHFSLFFIKSKK
jgi:hypothetical protein